MSHTPVLSPITMSGAGVQGLLLFSGYGTAQALSFLRNAVIGHALSPADFGIAASITLILQIVETLSDLGSDRLIVQAEDGDREEFVATAHSVLVMRGALLTAVLLAIGPSVARFFNSPQAASAFQMIALVPLIKGFLHLDCRRAQRRFDNRPQMYVEVIPQAVALAAALPALQASAAFDVVVWLSLAQAFAGVLISHLVSERRYRLALDRGILARQISFGWPILLSALPLIAVYQGDRLIIGRLSGMESLAAYSACFMLTMVPGLLAAKAGHALMLPLFSDALRRGRALAGRFKMMAEATTLGAALYLVFFIIAGETLLPLVFGAHYKGYGAVTAWLAAMWALRMIQAVPGMALMAAGHTKPFLVAGLVRASVLPFALWTAIDGAAISTIAAIAFFGECLSLFYVAARLESLEAATGWVLMTRAFFLLPAALIAVLAQGAVGISLLNIAIALVASSAAIIGVGIAVMPSLRAQIRLRLGSQTSIAAG